jgi:hypothetical protein
MRTQGVRRPVSSTTADAPSSIRVPSGIRSRSKPKAIELVIENPIWIDHAHVGNDDAIEPFRIGGFKRLRRNARGRELAMPSEAGRMKLRSAASSRAPHGRASGRYGHPVP